MVFIKKIGLLNAFADHTFVLIPLGGPESEFRKRYPERPNVKLSKEQGCSRPL